VRKGEVRPSLAPQFAFGSSQECSLGCPANCASGVPEDLFCGLTPLESGRLYAEEIAGRSLRIATLLVGD
jgi:hypothetical protein